MSRTQFNNASKIWNALVWLSTPGEDMWYERQWWGVGEIAKKAGMSRPTAKKYMEMALKEGRVMYVEFNGRQEYRIVRAEDIKMPNIKEN